MNVSTNHKHNINIPDRCLICYTDIIDISDSVSSLSIISKQLHVIFTLGTILEIPTKKLVSFLREWGNPSEWIKLCDQCNDSVNEAKNIYDEMLQMQRKFRAIQHDIVAVTKKSCSTKKRRNSMLLISDECREMVVGARKDISTRCTIDPFIAGDLLAHSLDTAGLAKQEAHDELEESILPNENEWLPPSTTPSRRSIVTSTSERQNRKRKSQEGPLKVKRLADSQEGDFPLVALSSRDGYSRKEFQQILKRCFEQDRKNVKEASAVSCPLCQSFQCKVSQSDVLCEHLETCKVGRHNSSALLLCPICRHFAREGLDHRVEFVEHLATCKGTRNDVIPPVRNRLFQCSACNEDEKKWMRVNEFLEHYLHHTRYRFKCTQCTHRFVTNESKDTHYHFKVRHPTAFSQDHPNTRAEYEPNLPQLMWWCPLCNEKFQSDDERDRHFSQVHLNNNGKNEGEKHVCQWCSKSYVCADELRLHQGTQHVYDEKQRVGKRRKIKNQSICTRARTPKNRDQHKMVEECSNSDEDEWKPPEEADLESFSEISEEDINANDPLVSVSLPVLPRDSFTKQEFLEIVKQQLSRKQLRKFKTPSIGKKLFLCNICPELQPMKLGAFLEHYLYHKRQIYRCTRCIHRFPSNESADTTYHYRNFHPEYVRELPMTRCIRDPVLPEYSWSCFYCTMSFPTEALRDAHSGVEHADEELTKHHKCDCCSSSFTNVEELLLHVAATHVQVMKNVGDNLNERKCLFCSQEFSNPSQLQNHQREKHREKLFICHICDRQCKNEYGLRLHVESHNPEKNIKMDVGLQGQQNAEKRTNQKCFLCPLCKEFKTRGGFGERLCAHLDVCKKRLEWEKEQNHEPLILYCTICNVYKTGIENKIDLAQHMAWCQEGKMEVQQTEPIPPLRSRIFQCSICIKPKKYMKLAEFLTHYLYHKKNRYKCTLCGILFHSQSLVNSHFVKKHCDVLKTFPPPSRFQYDESLPQFSWWCAYCNAQFSSDDLRDAHVLATHPNAKLPAESKMRKLPPVASLSDQVKEYRCFQCPKAYNVLTELTLHEGTAHVTENHFSCDECNESFVKIRLLRQHKVDKHQADVVVCYICGLKLKEKYLKNHMQTHQQVRSYPCEEPGCKQSFQTKEQRKLHCFRKHTPLDPEKNPLVCPHCPEPKVFHTRSYLNVHIRSFHFNVHHVQCHICGKGQQNNSKLQMHLSKNHGLGTSGQYKCSWEGCSKIFYEKNVLQQHIDMHRGEPQFKCSYCGKAFYFKTRLKRHELIHTNAESKPYQCEICAKRFPVQNYLYIHMKSHKKNVKSRS